MATEAIPREHRTTQEISESEPVVGRGGVVATVPTRLQHRESDWSAHRLGLPRSVETIGGSFIQAVEQVPVHIDCRSCLPAPLGGFSTYEQATTRSDPPFDRRQDPRISGNMDGPPQSDR